MTVENDETILISIIVPVYNVERFIEAGLDSVVEQNFSGRYEVILIDDCSEDNSSEICRMFMEKYPAIFSFFQNESNSGVSFTRNRGLDYIKGKYFMFLDPDDLLLPSSLTDLYHVASTKGVSVVKGNNTIFDDQSVRNANYNVDGDSIIEGDAMLCALYEHREIRGHVWGKLFSRSELGDVRFDQGIRVAEDLLYCSEVLSKSTKIALLDKIIYSYRLNNKGAARRKYETGSYIDWLHAIELSGKYITTLKQRQAHRSLQIRSLTELSRECRSVSNVDIHQILQTIESKISLWNINVYQLIFVERVSLQSIVRLFKMRLAINVIKNKRIGNEP